MPERRHFVTLGMFIIDEFEFFNEDGNPSGKVLEPQIGGGGTYAALGARIWLPPSKIGVIVDRGHDFPQEIQNALKVYGEAMWSFRDDSSRTTTRAMNSYRGEKRGFRYSTPRIRLTPSDLRETSFDQPAHLHFICSPMRAKTIIKEILDVPGWRPLTIFEPIPDRCVPEELPALFEILSAIEVLSPNAEEALSLLSMPQPPTKKSIEEACQKFLNFGIGHEGRGHVIIRSGAMGAYVASRDKPGQWIEAYWRTNDASRIGDVTGAGNSFLGGLSAGLLLSQGDVFEAVFYASVSASFTIEQVGLPRLTGVDKGPNERWNHDRPYDRLEELKRRHNLSPPNSKLP